MVERQVGAAQVDGDRLVPFGGLQLVDRRPHAVDAGVGEHDVEPPESGDQPLDHLPHRLGVRDVGHQGNGFPAGGLDLIRGLAHLGFRAAERADARARFRQTQGGRFADP